MNKFVDYYRTLQVHHNAEQDIINAAYRCFSKIYHPDINSNYTASEKMKMINVAYNTVGNPKRREDYHREWLKYNSGGTVGSADISQKDFYEMKASVDMVAGRVLESFFDDLINEEWEKSYNKLTSADNENIPIEDYIEWKEAVTYLYKLGNYKIQYYNCYQNCEYGGRIFPQILHFAVDLTEMEVYSGKISREQTQKYVALDNGDWKVCLGYSDLKPSIRKYQYLSQVLPKINSEDIVEKALGNIDPLTGALSRKGFTAEAVKEFQRSKRYGNPIALATVEIRPTEGEEKAFAEEKEMLISHYTEVISSNIRNTDIIGRCTETAIAILFIETKIESARITLMRLLELIELGENYSFEIYWAIAALESDDIDMLLADTMKKAILIRQSADEDLDTKRLGKYRLSDILEFNKRGRNHF